jgi:hypothetical protein
MTTPAVYLIVDIEFEMAVEEKIPGQYRFYVWR